MKTAGWIEERQRPSASGALLAALATASLAFVASLSLDRMPARQPARRPPPMLRIVTAASPPAVPAPPPFPRTATHMRPPIVAIAEPLVRMAAPAPPHPAVVRPRPAETPAAIAASPSPARTRSADPAFTHPALRPPEPPPATESPNAVRTLEGEIRAAVQDAIRYPAASRMMGEEGRALVGFVYRDRTVSEVRLLQSSGTARLDQAALETVREADYPPPGKAAGRTLSLSVWVAFRIDDG